MKKLKALKLLNPLLFLSFFTATVGMGFYKFGPGELQGSELALLFHEISGTVMIACGFIHLILNWSWIRNSYLKRRK